MSEEVEKMNGPNARRKIVCVLYDDPVDGYPPKYARDAIPTGIETKPQGGKSAVTPILALAVLRVA